MPSLQVGFRFVDDGYAARGRVKIGALGTISPALDGSRLVVRQRDRVTCYDLGAAEAGG